MLLLTILNTLDGILGNCSAPSLKAKWAVFKYAFCWKIISVAEEKLKAFCKDVSELSAVILSTLTCTGKEVDEEKFTR